MNCTDTNHYSTSQLATNPERQLTEEEENQEELVTIDLEEELVAEIRAAMMAEEGTVECVDVSGSHLNSLASGNASAEGAQGAASMAVLPLSCTSPSQCAPHAWPVSVQEGNSSHSPVICSQADPVPSVELEELVWVYLLSLMPEKAKLIWDVFFTHFSHPLDHFVLRLVDYEGQLNDIVLSANRHHSWMTTNHSQPKEGHQSNHELPDGTIYQYKVAFDCPDSTFKGAIFRAWLINSESGLCVDLGPLSIVSTASQRQRRSAKINRRSLSKEHERLAVNFKHHPPSRRHHRNGKGGRQSSRRGLPFLGEELALAVQLSAERHRGKRGC